MTPNTYTIAISPVPGRVAARRGDTVLASSTRAMVMHETRLPLVIYFPRDDVVAPLTGPTEHRTFCPFKGTASYWDVEAGDGPPAGGGVTLPNAAWSYDKALDESRAVEGMIAFMPRADAVYDYDEGKPAPHEEGNVSGPLVDWLMRGAWLCQSPEALTEALARRLNDHGIAVSRIGALIWSLHPSIIGRSYVWEKETGEVKTFRPSHELLENPAYVNSPMRHVTNGLGGVRQNLTAANAEFTFPIMDELRAAGGTDYVAMPLPFSQGRSNVLSLTCDHPKGFTTANLGLVFECVTAISRFYEVFALRENASALLETYLGKRTGARVLNGEIRRGDGDNIHAAILFCDLRGSSRLEQELGLSAYLDVLNMFFEAASDVINANNGEILKFIGDAVLAIFPTSGDHGVACGHAAAAASQIAEALHLLEAPGSSSTLDCAIGLSFGNVTYGNVGSIERLDFTVTGKAANVASRLSDLSKTQGCNILATAEIAEGRSEQFQSVGMLEVKGIAGAFEAFAPV
jgi:adenylate cyclase